MAYFLLSKTQLYLSIPLRLTLGFLFVYHAFNHLIQRDLVSISFFYSFPALIFGTAVFVGFFTRIAATGMLVILIVFGVFAKVFSFDFLVADSFESMIIMIAGTITIILSGGGKLSLENYFGFK